MAAVSPAEFTDLQDGVSALSPHRTGSQWTHAALQWTNSTLQWTHAALQWTNSTLQWTNNALQCIQAVHQVVYSY